METGLDLISYDNLFAAYIPGDLVVARDRLKEERLFVFLEVGKLVREARFDGVVEKFYDLRIDTWSLEWDTSSKSFTRKLTRFKISKFMGRRSIIGLPVYPLRLLTQEAQKVLLSNCAIRGREWRDLILKELSCWQQRGLALTDGSSDFRPDLQRAGQDMLQAVEVLPFPAVECLCFSDLIDIRSMRE
jgi:hypothetical protein